VACLWRPVYRCNLVTEEFKSLSAFQQADAWFEAEVPKDKTVTADHFSTTPAVPCPGGAQKVEVVEGPHFAKPYVAYISTNFVVSTANDAYDGADWRRKDYFDKLAREVSPRDVKYVESYVTRNRRLAETRLPSVRVFDSAPPGPTEVLLKGGVMVRQMPSFQVIEWQGPFTASENLAGGQAKLPPSRFNTALSVRAGEYDVFIEAQQEETSNGKFAGTAPSAVVTLANMKQAIECRFCAQRVYYVTSFSISSDAVMPVGIEAPRNCTISRFGLVRVGNPLPEFATINNAVFYGENLVANSDFDRGALRWNAKSDDNDFATEVASETTHGIRSLAVILKATCNLGIRQDMLDMTPGAEYLLTGNIACRDLRGNARLEVQDGKNGWKSFAKWTEAVSGTQTWKRVSLRFTLPDNVSQLALLLRRPADKSAGAGEGAIWFDDIRLHRIH
jgi:hypothetical protein